ncbi:MAG: ribonuclease HII [Deltaproteobacteria bacterium]|nr:ribonuclease HII [Deltaproteobacteria bacterium]
MADPGGDPARAFAARHRVRVVIGVDEVGRGPLAGPVVTGAVAFRVEDELPDGFTDSKALTAARRQEMLDPIRAVALGHALGMATVDEIDATGIRMATLEAMRRAVGSAWRMAGEPPCVVVVDGRDLVPSLALAQHALVDGDARCQAVGAASILAKEHRDGLLADLHLQHPQYGFDRHKGYGTADHLRALVAHGPCAHHRRSFEPVRTFLETGRWPPLPSAVAAAEALA